VRTRDRDDRPLRREETGRHIPRYRCTNTFKRGWNECSVREVHDGRIEDWVLEQIRSLQADSHLLAGVITRVNQAGDEKAHPLRTREADLAKRILEVRGAVDNMMDALASGGTHFQSVKARLAMEERTRVAVSVTAEQAGEYLGFLDRFWGFDGAASARDVARRSVRNLSRAATPVTTMWARGPPSWVHKSRSYTSEALPKRRWRSTMGAAMARALR